MDLLSFITKNCGETVYMAWGIAIVLEILTGDTLNL